MKKIKYSKNKKYNKRNIKKCKKIRNEKFIWR